MEDHNEQSFGKISAYPSAPESPSKSKLQLSIENGELHLYSDGLVKLKALETTSILTETMKSDILTVDKIWNFVNTPVIEGGEEIEGLSELKLNIRDYRSIIRVSNVAKENSFVISEESYIGFGTKWPSVKLDVNGGVQGTSAYSASSDKRFKTNINKIKKNEALEVISNLSGVKFDWKEREMNGKQFDITIKQTPGFIAQEVEKILPQVIHNDKNGYKSIKYTNVIPYLVEAIKHLNTKINDLESILINQTQHL